MVGGIFCGPSGRHTRIGGKEKSAMSQSTTMDSNKRVVRLTMIGAAIGGAIGFLMALYDSQSITMLAAYGMDVTASMAFMGGLIGANCVGAHD